MSSFIVLADGVASAAALPVFVAQTGTPAPAPAPVPASALGTDSGAPQQSPLTALIMPLMLLAVFFFIFAPQMKKNKQQRKMIEELKSGDDVVTTSGIFGTIVGVKPDRFVLEISKGVRIEIVRANVEMRAPDTNAAVKAADDKKA